MNISNTAGGTGMYSGAATSPATGYNTTVERLIAMATLAGLSQPDIQTILAAGRPPVYSIAAGRKADFTSLSVHAQNWNDTINQGVADLASQIHGNTGVPVSRCSVDFTKVPSLASLEPDVNLGFAPSLALAKVAVNHYIHQLLSLEVYLLQSGAY